MRTIINKPEKLYTNGLKKTKYLCSNNSGSDTINSALAGVGKPLNSVFCWLSKLNLTKRVAALIVIKNPIKASGAKLKVNSFLRTEKKNVAL